MRGDLTRYQRNPVSDFSVSKPAPVRSPRVVLACDTQSLEPYIEEWDALATALERPFCAPGWMLAWWRHGRTGDARLRVVLALDDRGLAGVGPFFAQVHRFGVVDMRLLAAGFCHRIGPLARPGQEPAVASMLADTLARMQPRADSVVFEGLDCNDPWPALIAAAWPGRRPKVREDLRMDAPVIALRGDYEGWLERRPRRFRKEARRTERRLSEQDVHGRVDPDQTSVTALLHLHEARWDSRGGTSLGAEAYGVLADAAIELGPGGRLNVALLASAAEPVAAELVLCAGDTAAFWSGGFSPEWASFAPGTQAMLLALRALAERGVQLADLGGGADEYKLRLADSNQPLVWSTLFPRGPRYPLIRARLAPRHARVAARTLLRRLPEAHLARLFNWRHRRTRR